MYVLCMYVCIIRGSRVGCWIIVPPAPGPQSPKLYTHVRGVDVRVWIGMQVGMREGGRGGVCSSENGSVRGTEPRVSVG